MPDTGQCGNDSVCQTFTCSAVGLCITNNVPNGTAIAAGIRITGNCKTIVCNGAGGTTTIINNDLLVDSIACTQNRCTNGNPVNPSENAGAASIETDGVTVHGNSPCVACLGRTTAAPTPLQDLRCSAADCAATPSPDRRRSRVDPDARELQDGASA